MGRKDKRPMEGRGREKGRDEEMLSAVQVLMALRQEVTGILKLLFPQHLPVLWPSVTF